MKNSKYLPLIILMLLCMMGYSQQKEPYFRGVHWGMLKQVIEKMEKNDLVMKYETFDSDENMDKLVYMYIDLDLGTGNIRNGFTSTFLTYYFKNDSLVKIHFPFRIGFSDKETCSYYFNDLVNCLSEIYNQPVKKDPGSFSCEWETKETRVTVSMKTEFMGPIEESYFMNISYTMETYENPGNNQMFLRVTLEKM